MSNLKGLKHRFARNPVEAGFTFDKYGALLSTRKLLRMEDVQKRIDRQLHADTGLFKRLTDTYYRTDVEFTDNPVGNTPTIGAGIKRYGKRPVVRSFREKLDRNPKRTARTDAVLKKREGKIVNDQKEYMRLYESLKPANEDSSEYVQYLVEGEQVMTGGGFDGNAIGEVQKSALLFVTKGNTHPTFGDNQFSKLVVEGALKLRDELKQAGLVEGSLVPSGCHEVRMEQDNDGMIGWPVYSKGWAELDLDIATRLLIESGVDCRFLVGRTTVDPRTGESSKAKVIDAIAYVLDNSVTNDPSDMPSVVTLLARIQKHGWKEENGELIPKKSKTRSVYPNAALAGMIEAMVGTPFIKELQRLKFKFMPSLLDKPSRIEIIKDLIKHGHAEDYEFLPLDESQYDATVIGDALATVMYYAVRPFYNAKYYDWVDFAIYCLVYKYLITDTALDSINSEIFAEAKKSGPSVESGPFTIFGMTDGLISGAKFTHVGGSFYGGDVIHYVIPKLMGFEPFLGVQAGDDCLFAIPKGLVDYKSAENTYGPIETVAKEVGIDINKLKQIFFVVDGEMVNIFLQDVYHESSDTWGTGSIFRPLTAVFFSERDKGLSIAEQFMAEIARMNQGADSAFAAAGVRKWLEMEQFIGSLFKEQGVSAFKTIINSAGGDVQETAERIDVGSFSFGVSKEDMKNGTLPILPIIAEVAKTMSFDISAAQALKALGEKQGEVQVDGTEGLIETDSDIGDSDDVLAD